MAEYCIFWLFWAIFQGFLVMPCHSSHTPSPLLPSEPFQTVTLCWIYEVITPSCSTKYSILALFGPFLKVFWYPFWRPSDCPSILHSQKALQTMSVWWKFELITPSHSGVNLFYWWILRIKRPACYLLQEKHKICIFKGLTCSILTKLDTMLHSEMLYTMGKKTKKLNLVWSQSPMTSVSVGLSVIITATVELHPTSSRYRKIHSKQDLVKTSSQ